MCVRRPGTQGEALVSSKTRQGGCRCATLAVLHYVMLRCAMLCSISVKQLRVVLVQLPALQG